MDFLRRDDLKELIAETGRFCVSVYSPTHRGGREIREDPIQLKDLLSDAKDQLEREGLNAREIDELLEPAQNLWRDDLFWEKQSDGLAVFLRDGIMRYYRLPLDLEPLVVVGHRFHVKPLLPLLDRESRFYLLSISEGSVKLYQGSGYSISELDPGNLPSGLAEALQYEDLDRHFQFHTSTRAPGVTSVAAGQPGAVAGRPGQFHGQGAADQETERTYILQYLRQVDEGIQELLDPMQAPLVLAGLDRLQAYYRQVNGYPQLLDEGVKGNPEEMDERELHRRAWEVVSARRATAREDAAALYRQLLGSGSQRASGEIESVVPAAYFQRVQALFVPLDRQVWGSFDAESGQIAVHEEPGPDDQDLLDLAAVHTFSNGGAVYPVEIDAVPGGGLVAAVFRY